MTYKFNPNTNPFADDLLRLSMAPVTRFSLLERYTLARMLAGKLYGLEHDGPDFPFWAWHAMYFYESADYPVVIDVLFDSDLREKEKLSKFDNAQRNLKLIVLSVGGDGVVELFNGLWDSSTRQAILSAIERMGTEEGIPLAQENSRTPARSDEEVRRDYLGEASEDRDRGTPVGGGGDGDRSGGRGGGGSGPGGGGDGANGGPGAGGLGELLNHPVLFAVEGNVFDAILEQT